MGLTLNTLRDKWHLLDHLKTIAIILNEATNIFELKRNLNEIRVKMQD
jgi:hypothetical protein